ncbi:PREDICTED: BAG family molecular chaperone regulator 3-like [Ipomoea nil]|uniref:BAG family molecular chaperone regulator 3-like n=1 Tax=Ipomoea nil TaxID=35883 RepID=UPI0009009D98|nr:PREDICTED: BAG family molecular chaperone regulator 3-like [Ipomoea nil]
MMRMKTKPTTTVRPPSQMTNGGSRVAAAGDNDWEMRPCGMLVQKRNPDSHNHPPPPPTIRVRVKYGSIYHEININSQATFGELKKMLTGPTGLHHQDQKLLFKDKERDSNAFLDVCGVKDKSKVVLVEDPISQEKRYLEMRKNAKMEKAAKSVSEISLEVDRLGGQVSALESVISRGGKVEEKTLINLIELLMNQLLKLDGIVAEGDVKLQRKMQVKRVQKYVETLDVLKINNSRLTSNGNHTPKQNASSPPHQYGYSDNQISSRIQQQQQGRHSLGSSASETGQQAPGMGRHSASSSGPFVISTQWETFDSSSAPGAAQLVPVSTPTTTSNNTAHPGFTWNLL